MRGTSPNAILCTLNQCERDIEQVQRRLSELRAKLGMVSASRVTCVTRPAAREAGARARLNSDCNLSTNLNSVCVTSAADAATHTQPISLGGLFRELPKRVPETYALWWWRYMKDREWQLTNGRRVTPQTWRMNLITFYNAAKSGELAEAKDEYNRFFGKAFPVQEKTAAEEWDSTCRDCDNFANGHCMACALRPPQSAALCKRFISNPTHL